MKFLLRKNMNHPKRGIQEIFAIHKSKQVRGINFLSLKKLRKTLKCTEAKLNNLLHNDVKLEITLQTDSKNKIGWIPVLLWNVFLLSTLTWKVEMTSHKETSFLAITQDMKLVAESDQTTSLSILFKTSRMRSTLKSTEKLLKSEKNTNNTQKRMTLLQRETIGLE